jgi:hypothetical protein
MSAEAMSRLGRNNLEKQVCITRRLGVSAPVIEGAMMITKTVLDKSQRDANLVPQQLHWARGTMEICFCVRVSGRYDPSPVYRPGMARDMLSQQSGSAAPRDMTVALG